MVKFRYKTLKIKPGSFTSIRVLRSDKEWSNKGIFFMEFEILYQITKTLYPCYGFTSTDHPLVYVERPRVFSLVFMSSLKFSVTDGTTMTAVLTFSTNSCDVLPFLFLPLVSFLKLYWGFRSPFTSFSWTLISIPCRSLQPLFILLSWYLWYKDFLSSQFMVSP